MLTVPTFGQTVNSLSLNPSPNSDQNCVIEVRLSSNTETLFGSTRGLYSSHRGYITSFPLLTSGLPHSSSSQIDQDVNPPHIYQTRTSGGWANAISIAPRHPNGHRESEEEFIALTDSEKGFVQILKWTPGRSGGFETVADYVLSTDDDVIGASVAVWYD